MEVPRETLQVGGLLVMMAAGSALDSHGWAMWVAVVGVLTGMMVACLGERRESE